MPKIAILIGSDSKLEKLKECFIFLKEVSVDFELNILSAHRLSDETAAFCKKAAKNCFEAIIAAVGIAANLPGFCAWHTQLPVIGLPVTSGSSNGMDALMSIVQMPAGLPVATVGINNFQNAAVLACIVLALKYPDLAVKLAEISKKNCQNT